jgi:pescadillo protein
MGVRKSGSGGLKKKSEKKANGILRKGVVGTAANYITRNMALKKLQLSLPDFRRLCILKGIYPREPKKKVHGRDKTYYLSKDIVYLLHEPMLATMRAIRAHKRKVKKAAGRHELSSARRIHEARPKTSLDHIIKERCGFGRWLRLLTAPAPLPLSPPPLLTPPHPTIYFICLRYPTFPDALRDLDDALSMVFLFSQLPAEGKIDPVRTKNCARLAREFELYVAKTHSLTKVFLSIKGIYYQAVVFGQTVTWLSPFQFAQEVRLGSIPCFCLPLCSMRTTTIL